MGDGHKERHDHSDTGKYDVEPQRKGHLGSGGYEVVHGNRFTEKISFSGLGTAAKGYFKTSQDFLEEPSFALK
jgi:hypothetical protein